MFAIAIKVDERGRVFVGEIPSKSVPALERAVDVATALATAKKILTGAEEREEKDFESGYKKARRQR
jgi:hypothetical protein